MQPTTFTDWPGRCVIQTPRYMTVYWAALSDHMTQVFTAERAQATLFPLPAAERGGHTRPCSGGVFVLLLCGSPGARARCGFFSAIVQLHSVSSWQTDWLNAGPKKKKSCSCRRILSCPPASHVIEHRNEFVSIAEDEVNVVFARLPVWLGVTHQWLHWQTCYLAEQYSWF